MTQNTADLSEIVNNFKGIPVLVIGDVMLDRFVSGTVDRISPESPVPVLAIKGEEQMLGGAGNALANIQALGGHGKILSVIGDDAEGQAVRDAAEEIGVAANGFLVTADRSTIVKTRFLAGHQQLLRTDSESSVQISEDLERDLLARAKQEIDAGVKAIVLSDYGKGLLSKTLIQGVIKAAEKAGVPVLVDPKGLDYSIYAGASAVTPNKKELVEATGLPVETDEEVEAAARQLMQKHKIDAVVATRSADGMSVVQKNDITHLPGAPVDVYDVSGAGDTVIASLAMGLAAGANLESAAQIANLAGSIVVTKVGTAAIRAAELHDAISGVADPRRKRHGAICNWDDAREMVQRWQAKGLKTGFTNGCFDILHYGHVSYLAQARDHCDRLIVAVNKDSSVKILKGEDRPVHSEDSRARVLAALDGVDMVVFFGADQEGEDNTASALISMLQPDLYFKGGDYKVEDIPEAPAVQAYGGSIKLMPVYDGHSTTGSIAKIKAA